MRRHDEKWRGWYFANYIVDEIIYGRRERREIL